MEKGILKMNRDELIDFLIKNDTYIIPKLPTGREKEFFNNNPDFHTTDILREYALTLAD
jgi:hypothetical protein